MKLDLDSKTINALGFWVNYCGLHSAMNWADACKCPLERLAYRNLFIQLWEIGHPKKKKWFEYLFT